MLAALSATAGQRFGQVGRHPSGFVPGAEREFGMTFTTDQDLGPETQVTVGTLAGVVRTRLASPAP